MLKIFNQRLYLLADNMNIFLNNLFREKIFFLFLLILIISYTSFLSELPKLNLLCIPIIFLIMLMNTSIHFFFSLLIFIQYILPIFINSSEAASTSNSPDYINSLILFISFSAILIINLNLLLKKKKNKNVIIQSFNFNFLYFLFLLTLLNYSTAFFFHENLKYIPFFWQIFSKSLYFYFFPIIFLLQKNKINHLDRLIILVSIINIFLFVYLNNYSRSIILIFILIMLFFYCKNIFQIFFIICISMFLYPFIHFFRSELIFNNFDSFIMVMKNLSIFELYCIQEYSNPLKYDITSENNYCLILDNIQSVHIFNFFNYVKFLLSSFFERLYNVHELSTVLLNNYTTSNNIYFNNFYSLIPSVFIEKPDFFIFNSFDLFYFQLKPITDFSSTSTFGVLTESLVILKYNYIYIYVLISFIFFFIYFLNNKLFYNQSSLSLHIVFTSMFIFKESYTAILIDLLFYLLLIFSIKFFSRYFIQN